MLRAILIFFATSMLTCAIPFWYGRGDNELPETVTVDDVISGRRGEVDLVTLKGVTLEFEHARENPHDQWQQLVPIAGTSGRLAVRWDNNQPRPPKTGNVSGLLEPFKPWKSDARNIGPVPAYSISYLNDKYLKEEHKEAIGWMIAAGVALLWALVVQVRVWIRRPPASDVVTLPASDTGKKCCVCSAETKSAPCHLRVRTSRATVVDKAVDQCRKAGVQKAILLCPDCQRRLSGVRIRRPFLLLALWALCIAYPALGLKTDSLWSGLVGTPIVLIGVYLAFNFWLNSLYQTAMGGLLSDQLKAKFAIDSWTVVEKVKVTSPGS